MEKLIAIAKFYRKKLGELLADFDPINGELNEELFNDYVTKINTSLEKLKALNTPPEFMAELMAILEA